MTASIPWLVISLFALGTLSTGVLNAAEPPVLLDDMGGLKPTLRLIKTGTNARLVEQSVQPGGGRQESGAERLRFLAPPGSTTEIAYSLPSTPVIDELAVQVWLHCSQPGVRLAARVSLARTINPETGQPYQLLLVGPASSQGLLWEQLKLSDLSKELARQARVARAQHGSLIDERGATLQELVLLAPGATSGTELVVDEIAMHGVFHGSRTRQPPASQRPFNRSPAATEPLTRPQIPRVLQWQGEPFQVVRDLGFDAASLDRPPTEEQLDEARQAGLFLICPPDPIVGSQEAVVDQRYEGILAWDLGEITEHGQIEQVSRVKEELARRETEVGRPTLLRPRTSIRRASRISDVMLLGKSQVGSTSTLAEFAQQLSGMQRHTSPGSHFWVNLNTQYAAGQVQQLAAVWPAASRNSSATYHELLDTAFASLGCRPRGFYFESRNSLSTTDRDARKRAAAAELVNLRLGLAEPWLAAGKPGQARSSDPDVTAVVLETERSHLLVPVRWTEANASPSSTSAITGNAPLSFLVSGVPESIDAYLLAWDGPKRLRTQRVAGGIRVTCNNLPRDAMLLLTQDPRAIAQVGRYLQKYRSRATKLLLDTVRYEVEDAELALAALPTSFSASIGVSAAMSQVDAFLRHSDSQRQARNYKAALVSRHQADRLLTHSLRSLANKLLSSTSLGELPWNSRWSTLPATHRLLDTASRSRVPWQEVPSGRFENLAQLMGNGWRHLQHTSQGLTTAVRLSGEAPAEGSYCLQLVCEADQSTAQPTHATTPPVWVTSSGLNLSQGQMIEITGKVRVTEQPLGVDGGLLVFDSLAAENSALRIRDCPSWKAFRLVRLANSSSELALTFALGGAGTAEIDDLQYRVFPVGGSVGPVQTVPTAQFDRRTGTSAR